MCAHGLYSWVPPPVRDALLGLVRRALAPTGVGYVSYNTLPGCHLRRVLWDMLRFHTARVPDLPGKLEQTDQFLQFLLAAQENRDDPPSVWLKTEVELVRSRPTHYLTAHDDLGEVNDPVYFVDFAEHAGRHGLRFLAEADLASMADEVFPPAVARVLADLGRQNQLAREQYRDFLRLRRFRATLLCHADRPVRTDPDREAAADLFVTTGVRPVGEPVEDGPAEFLNARGATTTVDHPPLARLLTRLADRAPERVRVADAARDAGVDLAGVLDTARAGLTTLHDRPAPAVRTAGERPTASLLARVQAGRGGPISTLTHATLDDPDAATRVLLPLLDGTRTRADLLATLSDGGRTPDETADRLAVTLDTLARAGVLQG